ncbi:hypothetical protein [Bowmanella dokdonensis]|uniref:Uncharacterized protein n=1 Tax=Bowmanella dokdonensis TaxID=751969 RepID=A0A939IQU4_9ALTE|nr:hypothetical protein [Bowmanella dokdonensis]MBN7824791.1 hypothetical protein [Bowmanella dokdonensis]
MSERTYVIADVVFITPLLSEAGLALLQQARLSLDGSQVFRNLNHSRARIEAMFKPGVDVDAVLAQCEHLDAAEAEARMSMPEWSEPLDPEAMA